MATLFKKLPNKVTLILIRSAKFPESEELINKGYEELITFYPELSENITLFRGDHLSDSESMLLLEERLDTHIKGSISPELKIDESLSKTLSFIRNKVLKGGVFFFILPISSITSLYKEIFKTYRSIGNEEAVPKPMPINWTEVGIVILRVNDNDFSTSKFPRKSTD
ncbi:MAG: hypothetical protein ACI88L_000484 [Candidatus Paceibacteria bacterium]|jgi:hypothetical protein